MEKKWYQTTWGISLLLFFFFPAGLFCMWKYGMWDKRIKWSITALLILLTLGFNVLTRLNTNISTSPEHVVSTNSPVYPTDVPRQYKYEILDKNENKTVDNYKVLINPGDDGKAIAMEVKKGCNKPCNIDIYDDKHALELQREYDAMMGTLDTQPQELQAWKLKNYLFVADHLVGYVDFESGSYQEYPYRDWYYDELKGK